MTSTLPTFEHHLECPLLLRNKRHQNIYHFLLIKKFTCSSVLLIWKFPKMQSKHETHQNKKAMYLQFVTEQRLKLFDNRMKMAFVEE